MAVFNEPAQWDHTLGNNADTSTLPDDAAATAGIASLQKLFQLINATPLEAGGIAPDREDINALFKYLGDSIFYAMNGGVPSYNAAYDYIAGRVVSYNDNLYKCIQANGVSSTVVTPDSNTAYWRRLDNFVRSVNGVNADVNGNVQIGFPSDTFINVTSFPFTAPSDGWITVRSVATASIPGAYTLLETKSSGGIEKLISISARYYDTETSTGDTLPVKKGDIVNIAFNNMRLVTAKFFYAEGEI